MAQCDDHADSVGPVPARRPRRPDRPQLRTGVLARFGAAVSGVPLTTGADQEVFGDRICHTVADLLPVDGVSISVYVGADLAMPIGTSDPDATIGEALQFTLREGPCLQAYTDRVPVLVPDVRHPESTAWSRWPIYAEQFTRRTSYRAVFAFPLLSERGVLGSLSLYRRRAGNLRSVDQIAAIASWIGVQLLNADTVPGPSGELEHRWMDGPTSSRRHQVWLAQGHVAQANKLTSGQAVALLRAGAFTDDRILDDVATDIVGGRLPVPILEADR